MAIYNGVSKLSRPAVDLEVLAFDLWSTNCTNFKNKVVGTINELIGESGRVGLFGVGYRSISTLYSLDLTERIVSAYDDSREKIGKFIPNTKVKIYPSTLLDDDKIDLILLGVNYENEAKIVQNLRANKLLLRSILPPSDILLWSNSINY